MLDVCFFVGITDIVDVNGSLLVPPVVFVGNMMFLVVVVGKKIV